MPNQELHSTSCANHYRDRERRSKSLKSPTAWKAGMNLVISSGEDLELLLSARFSIPRRVAKIRTAFPRVWRFRLERLALIDKMKLPVEIVCRNG